MVFLVCIERFGAYACLHWRGVGFWAAYIYTEHCWLGACGVRTIYILTNFWTTGYTIWCYMRDLIYPIQNALNFLRSLPRMDLTPYIIPNRRDIRPVHNATVSRDTAIQTAKRTKRPTTEETATNNKSMTEEIFDADAQLPFRFF